MSGQWEVVGKSKKKQNGANAKILNKTEQKKAIENGPKIEEILPLSQVQSLYDALSKDVKENKKPGKENHAKDNATKKPQKKPQAKKKDMPKPALPKTLDTAVKLVNKKELCSELEMGQTRFPDAPLVWLKGLVGYLNTKLTVENVHSVFEGKSHEYPQNLLSGELHNIFKRSVLNIDEAIAQSLFEWCLTAMANDLSRGDKVCGAVLGYKLIMQLLSFHNPPIVVNAIPKMKTLLASYHNRQSIGLSLLWAMGQGGYKDLGVGLRVWQEVMLPLVDLRLYSAYVLSYLHTLLGLHPGTRPLQADHLLPTLRVLCSPPDSVPTNRRKEFQEMSSMLMVRVMELPYETTLRPLFPFLLRHLEDSAPAKLQRELQSVLFAGLLADTKVGKSWVDIYPHLRPQSRLLLVHISKSWNKVPKTVHNQLKKVLLGIQAANHILEKQGVSDPHAQAGDRLSKELLGRMAIARTVPGFPWMRANLLLLTAISALLVYDLRRHGCLRASSTGHLLHDIGALSYVEYGWSQTQSYTQQSYSWLQDNGPEYYRKASEISRPYLAKAQELLLAGASHMVTGCQAVYAYAQEKAPLVSEWIEQWAPGLRDRTVEFGNQAWEQGKVYSIAGGKALLGYGQEAVSWARTNVFVGTWSPDNLQQYSLAVLNVTQQYALGTYDWLYEKVQTFSKVD